MITASAIVLALVTSVPGAFSNSGKVRAGGPLTNAQGQTHCTFNFTFQDASGNKYIGTAAHCIDPVNPQGGSLVSAPSGDRVGQRVWSGDPDSVTGRLGAARQIGTVVWSDGAETDFALVRVDSSVQVISSIKGIASLKGVASEQDGRAGEIAYIHGYGLGMGEVEPSRTRPGVVYSHTYREYNLDAPTFQGDSGGPVVTDDGYALGITSKLALSGPSTVGGPTVQYVLNRLAASGFILSLLS